MFQFKVHPAYMSVWDGVGHAFAFLSSTWRRWVLAIAALAVVYVALYLVFGRLGGLTSQDLYTVDPQTGIRELAPDAESRIAGYYGGLLATMAAGMVVGWWFTAIAIAGLRGWRLSPSFVLGRGIVAFVAELIVILPVLAVAAVWVAITIGLVIAVASVQSAVLLTLVSLGVGLVLLGYVMLRLTFIALFAFDGLPAVASVKASWQLSKGAVLRVLGWALVGALVVLPVTLAGATLNSTLAGSRSVEAVAALAAGGLAGVSSAFGIVLGMMLYESQRARRDPSLYSIAAPPPTPEVPLRWPHEAG